METFDIEFSVNGTIKQTVKILTGESPFIFFKKIKEGDYLTSISTNSILALPSLKKVGEIEFQETSDNTEFDSFVIL